MYRDAIGLLGQDEFGEVRLRVVELDPCALSHTGFAACLARALDIAGPYRRTQMPHVSLICL